MIKNIIFDWSGTLVDDLPAVWEATNHVFRQAGVPEITLEKFRAEFCLPFKPFYDKYLPHVAPAQMEQWFHGRFREVQDAVVELPHARDFLEWCAKKNLRLFVLTAVPSEHFDRQARTMRFENFFEKAYTGAVDKRKIIPTLLKEQDLAPEETLFVGDMQHDVETAKFGGTRSAAVLTGYNSLEQLRASSPDLVVEHLRELRELLEQADGAFSVVASARPVVTVGALIFNDADEVLMLRTHKWSNMWGIPGGKTRYLESSEDALRRETREETALELDDIEFVLVQDCINSPEFYRPAHFVLLNYTARARGAQVVRLNDEAQEHRWVPVEAALELNLNTPTRRLLEAVAAQWTPSRSTT
ncbi:MAG TPA: HAD hydrolase-like protein [Methylomirabilota bacterium]|nr:HAD hydrolase-like protein [Methylomirabilota bacterium]